MVVFHHFLGPNNVDHINNQAYQKLLSLLYQRKINNWTFENFVTAHKEQHIILEGLTDHIYCGLDARTKVVCLLDGIQTDSLGAVKSNIMQDRKLRRYFERCVTFYKDFIKQSSGNQSN